MAFGGGGVSYGKLSNCVIVFNACDWGAGGALFSMLRNSIVAENDSGDRNGTVDCELFNSLVWNNRSRDGELQNDNGTSTFHYSCTTPLPQGDGNIDVDPLFVDAANGNFRLRADSPCRDAGNNAYVQGETDLDGKPRIINGTVDMGAYEYQEAFTMAFDAQGGTVSPTSMTFSVGSPYGSLPTPTRDGYMFAGWWTEAGVCWK